MPLGSDGQCDIVRANLDGSDVQSNFIVAPDCRSTALAADEGHVYWGELTADGPSIARAPVGGGGLDTKFITACPGTATVSSIALDAGHVYWSDGCSASLHRADLDGKNIEPDWIPGAGASSIAVSKNALYWVGGGDGFIHRANIDGSQVDDHWLDAVLGDSVLAGGVATDGSAVYWVAHCPAAARSQVGERGRERCEPRLRLAHPVADEPRGDAERHRRDPAAHRNAERHGRRRRPAVHRRDHPLGSTVDVTEGSLQLHERGTATLAGRGVTSRLRVLSVNDQGRKLVELRLVGGNFATCKKQPHPFTAAPRKPTREEAEHEDGAPGVRGRPRAASERAGTTPRPRCAARRGCWPTAATGRSSAPSLAPSP